MAQDRTGQKQSPLHRKSRPSRGGPALPWRLTAAINRYFSGLSTFKSGVILLACALLFAELLTVGVQVALFDAQDANHVALVALIVAPLVSIPLIYLCVITIKSLDRSKNRLKTTAAELDRRLLELQRTQKLWQKAESESLAKSAFLANMSHELRTPLNAILGFSEVMREETFGPLGNTHYLDYARDIHDAGSHLLMMIGDILDLSKIEAGSYELHEGPVDVSVLIASCLRLMAPRSHDKKIGIETAIEGNPPRLWADERVLKQLLINLLSNAVKFSNPGSRILVRTWQDEEAGLALSIADQGIGIAPEDMEKVLSPFGQVDSVTARKEGGTGLGLPLSKAFTEMHGGRLELESETGKGTTVTIRLPGSRLTGAEEKVAPPTPS